jgi:hypothetical protein
MNQPDGGNWFRMNKQYRQGDVFITRINSIPETATVVPRDNNKVILAYGDVTGHCHAIDATGVSLLRHEGVSYLEIAEALAELHHDEHATIQLPAGKYAVRIQREYTPETIRSVAD